MNRFDDTLQFIAMLEAADTPYQVCQNLLRVTSRFGLDRLIAGTIPSGIPSRVDQEKLVLFCGWPEEWMERYFERNYVSIDPVIDRTRQTLSPFDWNDMDMAGAGTSVVLDEAREYKLNSGHVVPFVSLDGNLVAVSLAGEQAELSQEVRGMISLISSYAIGRVIQLNGQSHLLRDEHAPEIMLTPREAECMRWASLGKSEWEISVILGISEHTSEKHLLNAKSKLGAVNRVQAVAEAIRRGYIT